MKKIKDATPITSANGTDVMAVSQNDDTAKKISVQQISDYVAANKKIDNKLDKAVPTTEQGTKEYLYSFAGTTQHTNIAVITDMTSQISSYDNDMVPTALSVAELAGGLNNLETTEKSNLVGAINEVNSGKANKVPVVSPTSASSYTLAVDTLTQLGTLTGSITLTLATAPSDEKVHIYDFIFTAGATAPTITFPAGISWAGGSAPTITAGKTYEISISNNLAVAAEY